MKQRKHNVLAELGLTESALTKLMKKRIPEGPDKVFSIAKKFKAAAFLREIDRVKNFIDEGEIYPEDLIWIDEENLTTLQSNSLVFKGVITGDYIKLVELFSSPKKWVICWRSPQDL